MSSYRVGQRVLVRTSIQDAEGKYHLAGREGVIVGTGGDYWPEYTVEVQMPDGAWQMRLHNSRREHEGFILDTPKNREKYPIPDWGQLDLKEMHDVLRPFAVRMDKNAFDGFIATIAKACGGIPVNEVGEVEVVSNYDVADSRRDVICYKFQGEARCSAFLAVLHWIKWHENVSYSRGVERGHNLLMEMSSGELTPAMFVQEVRDKTRVDRVNPFKDR